MADVTKVPALDQLVEGIKATGFTGDAHEVAYHILGVKADDTAKTISTAADNFLKIDKKTGLATTNAGLAWTGAANRLELEGKSNGIRLNALGTEEEVNLINGRVKNAQLAYKDKALADATHLKSEFGKLSSAPKDSETAKFAEHAEKLSAALTQQNDAFKKAEKVAKDFVKKPKDLPKVPGTHFDNVADFHAEVEKAYETAMKKHLKGRTQAFQDEFGAVKISGLQDHMNNMYAGLEGGAYHSKQTAKGLGDTLFKHVTSKGTKVNELTENQLKTHAMSTIDSSMYVKSEANAQKLSGNIGKTFSNAVESAMGKAGESKAWGRGGRIAALVAGTAAAVGIASVFSKDTVKDEAGNPVIDPATGQEQKHTNALKVVGGTVLLGALAAGVDHFAFKGAGLKATKEIFGGKPVVGKFTAMLENKAANKGLGNFLG